MSDLSDIIDDAFPGEAEVAVPLNSQITMIFTEAMDEDSLTDTFLVEGPDTDQFVGPGGLIRTYPDNISQGDPTDFLASPGYRGIVEGVTAFVDLAVGDDGYPAGATTDPVTKIVFTPTRQLAKLTSYSTIITDSLTLAAVAKTGLVVFNWTTGTGSISSLPTTASSSVLSQSVIEEASSPTALSDLGILLTSPANHEIEVGTGLETIVITFDKAIDAGSFAAADIGVEIAPATDHPNANVSVTENVAKAVSVSGAVLTLTL